MNLATNLSKESSKFKGPPKVSIIIPAKNESKYIATCLTSLHKSVHVYGDKSVEVILVDNGSSDETVEIADTFNCKIIREPSVNSISRLRNIGARYARNEIIAFLDADCLVDPMWIKLCVEVINGNDAIGVVGTPAVPNLNDSTWVEKCLFNLMAGSISRPSFVPWLGSSNIFVYKNLFLQVGGFDENLSTGEDVNFCYSIAQKDKLIYLEKRITTNHTRESKTLYDFFQRELWRGKNSIKSLVKNNFSKNEIMSVLVPSLYLCSFLMIFFGIIFSISYISLGSFTLILIFPIVFMIKKKVPFFPIINLPKYFLISFVYLCARASALIAEGWSLLVTLFRRSGGVPN